MYYLSKLVNFFKKKNNQKTHIVCEMCILPIVFTTNIP